MRRSRRAPTSWRITCARSGVGPETVVGLCVERSPEMVIGLLGILKAGGAYLPLDPDYPAERLAFMLADAGAAVLVTPGGAARAAGRGAAPAPPRHHGRPRAWCGSMPTGPTSRASPTSAPALALAPAAPRLRHLHLGLHRNPKRRRRQRMVSIVNFECCAESNSMRDWITSTRFLLLRRLRLMLRSPEYSVTLVARRHAGAIGRHVSRIRRSRQVLGMRVNCFLAVPSLYGALIEQLSETCRNASEHWSLLPAKHAPSNLVDGITHHAPRSRADQ